MQHCEVPNIRPVPLELRDIRFSGSLYQPYLDTSNYPATDWAYMPEGSESCQNCIASSHGLAPGVVLPRRAAAVAELSPRGCI